MTNLSTIATIIDIALDHGVTGEQAINLLKAIREQINDQEQLEWLEAEALAASQRDADFLKALGPPPHDPDSDLCPACGDDVSEPADGGWYCLKCGNRWV